MYKKVVYVVKNKMHYYPPCISQIRMLNKAGVQVDVIYGTSNEVIVSRLEKEGINCKKISNQINYENENKLKKLLNWYRFRIAFLREMKKYDKNTIFWFGTAETVLPLLGKLRNKNYIISFLELMDKAYLKRFLLNRIVKRAKAITVCEETRGYLMKSWWKLDELPYVFPNKPFEQMTIKKAKPTSDVTEKIINDIKDKKIILYQGILQNTEEIVELAKALKNINSDYYFLLMGIDKYNSFKKIKQEYDKTLYYEYVPAPLHLEVTSYAKIGVAFYRPDDLNRAFCAPNKIYEYAGFGIPILCNSIPGLINTVGRFSAGKCVKFTGDCLKNAIMEIEDNYNFYSNNAKKFFNETDNLQTMERLISQINISKEEKDKNNGNNF